MPDPTNAERQRRWYQRQRLGLECDICTCGRRAYGQHAPLCSRCWLKTPAGQLYQRTKTQRARQRDKP